MITDCPFSYAENWELFKLIEGTKFGKSHVFLHTQTEYRL